MDSYVGKRTEVFAGGGGGVAVNAMNDNGAGALVFFGVFIAAGLVYTWVRQSICNK